MLGDFNEGANEFDGAFKEQKVAPRRRRPLRDDEDAAPGGEAGANPAPPPARMNGGWSEGDGSDVPTLGGVDEDSTGRRRGAATSSTRAVDDDDDGIPVIPDLDETAAESEAVVATVAIAPVARQNARVQSIAELDLALTSNLPSAIETGIDLGALKTALYPAEQLVEPDEVWDFDGLSTEISHDLFVNEAADASRAGRLTDLHTKASATSELGGMKSGAERVGSRAALAAGNTRLSDD
ncbi:intraflagellar transport protein 43-domain-containing protein [Pavlovales sp. CCMP2436]|nr:intraflagellar transport protein 43-domain-containing protein [Pavlovales sp. CCMP2436]